jgi:WD40 repeat protein
VKIWSLSDGKLLKTLQSKPALSWDDGVYNLSFTKDGKFFVSGCGGQMSVFSLPSWNLIGTRPGPHGRQYRMGLLGKGDEAACVVNTGGSVERNVVCLVPLAGGEPTELGKGAPTPCLTGQLTVSHDGKHLLLYDTAKIQVWSLAKRQLLKEAKLPKSITSCPLFSPKDDEFIYLSDEGTVERVAFPSLDVKGSLKGDDGVCGPIALSSDGSLLATGGRDNTVRLQSMPDGKLLRVLKGHPKDMESIVFSPDGKKLISGDSGGTIIIWELEPNGRHWALRDFGW